MTSRAPGWFGRHLVALAVAAVTGGLTFFAVHHAAVSRGFDVVVEAGEATKAWLLIIGCGFVVAWGTYALVFKQLERRAQRRAESDRVPSARVLRG
jgi:hypothetical protein